PAPLGGHGARRQPLHRHRRLHRAHPQGGALGMTAGGTDHLDRSVPFERIDLDGTSWVDVARGWVVDADAICERLLTDVRWHTSSVFRYDHHVEQRRLVSG